MHKVKSFIGFKLSDIKTIEDVARIFNTPSETLRKKFYREEKIHLSEFILQCKIVTIKEMLIISDLPCFEICYSIGLREDTGAKIFKKFAGMTMLQFRKKYREEFLKHKLNPLIFEYDKHYRFLNDPSFVPPQYCHLVPSKPNTPPNLNHEQTGTMSLSP